MMLKDNQGLQVSTDSPVAIAAINRFIDQALGYGCETETVLLQGNIADRECVLIHAYLAAYYLSQEAMASRKSAIPHLKAAQGRLAEITERERLFVQAIAAWANGAIDHAIELHETLTDRYPQDLISVQQGQYHYFYQGNFAKLLRIAEKVLPHHQENHYLYGMLAFGLEQVGNFAEAEVLGRRAVALNRHDPWAQHAVAHVLDTQGRSEEGIDWMESLADTWKSCNSMLYTHNWWHVALYYLSLGNFEKVLDLYDTQIWGHADKEASKDQVNAIAILLRLELRGIQVGSRWHDLTPYLLPRIHEHALPFQDVHYIYALERAAYQSYTTEMLYSMKAYADTVTGSQRQTWVEVAIPAAKGIKAFANDDRATATALLQPILPRLAEIGGSRTQRALFKQIYQASLQNSTIFSQKSSLGLCDQSFQKRFKVMGVAS